MSEGSSAKNCLVLSIFALLCILVDPRVPLLCGGVGILSNFMWQLRRPDRLRLVAIVINIISVILGAIFCYYAIFIIDIGLTR
ncbi:hypothetical protein [Butyricicoccus intestinisimiae]|uniref:Uncharacterized protein n=1 Tax=Butyricicoccus intestinisimiae TaxID=2841509 RepID=A0ABS6EP47_9FIRM|nr:hypothetical protein [Butyricicoccus intestinisimiae]MBU5489451.1 hypothetical protein [Butyricicoccus intestinisimiae]